MQNNIIPNGANGFCQDNLPHLRSEVDIVANYIQNEP